MLSIIRSRRFIQKSVMNWAVITKDTQINATGEIKIRLDNPAYSRGRLALLIEPLRINTEKGTSLAKEASLFQALENARVIKEICSSQEQSLPGLGLSGTVYTIYIEVPSLNGENH